MKLAAAPIEPPSAIRYGSCPKTSSMQRAAARTAGWSTSTKAGSIWSMRVTATSTPGTSTDRIASRTRSNVRTGSMPDTSRHETFAWACAGMIVLLALAR